MKLYVNEDCIGCGLCENICPEVFQMTDEGIAKATDEEIEEKFFDSANEAKESCPVSAIVNREGS